MSTRFATPAQATLLRFRALQEESEGHTGSVQTGESPMRRPLETRDLNEIEREAFQKGYAAGERTGLEMADKKLQSMLNRFAQSIEELSQLKRHILSHCETDLVSLSLEIAQKLVHREIRMDPQIIVTLARVALNQVNGKGKVTLWVSPQDYQILEPRLTQLLPDSSENEVELKSKQDLNRGDCLLESGYGTLDARISQQFQEVEKGLIGEF